MYVFPNGKRYIGKTCKSMNRRKGRDWKRYKTSRLLWEAICEYGTENIKTEILYEGVLSDEEASEMERFFIAKYKTNANRYNNPSYGYNLTDGGLGLVGWHPTEARYKEMMDQLEKAKEVRLRNGVSDETRRKLSEAHKKIRGWKHSEETKRKIGLANSLENMSDEERERRSRSKMRKVMAINSVTGEELHFESQTKAAEYFGVRESAVTRWINGTRRPRIPYKFISEYSPTTTERKGTGNSEATV